MRYLPALTLCVLLVSCSPEPSPSLPVTSPSTSEVATPQPTVDVSSLPSPQGWSPRPQVSAAQEAEAPWADQRDIDELLAILESYACLKPGALPEPASAIEGTYELPTGEPAVLEVMEFASQGQPEAFADMYVAGSLGCGAASIGEGGLQRDVDGAKWTEIVVVGRTKLTLATIQRELSGSEMDHLRAVLESEE